MSRCKLLFHGSTFRLLPVVLLAFFAFFLFVATGELAAQEETAPDEATGESDAIQCMTYNIRFANPRDGEDYWPNRKSTVAKVIEGADVVGMQEVVPLQMDDLKSLTTGFEWYGVARNDGKLDGEMTTIAWRSSKFKLLDSGTFWLSPTPEKIGSKGWDAALPRIASWVKLETTSGQPFLFLNTHFDHMGGAARANSAALIYDWANKQPAELPIVIVGDLNATLGTAPLDNLLHPESETPLLFNARAISEKPDAGPDSTWNGFRKIADGRRIDFVIVKKGVRIPALTTLNPKTEKDRFASDHMPIVATVEF